MSFETHQFSVDQRRIVTRVLRHPQIKKTIIVGPAMGVRSSFYEVIAEQFYDQGFNCILFDYHGMFYDKASARPADIASFGKIDLTFVVDYALEVLHAEELYFLGHSISGQVLPLARNANAFKAAYLVGAQSVDVTNWSGRSRFVVSLFWNLLIPLTTVAFPYLPPWVYGGKHPLAKSVARDWARLARSEGGVAEDTEDNMARYGSFRVPTKFISIEGDDLLAPRRAVKHLFEQYASPVKDLQHHSARSTTQRLDHFSFFKKQNQHLWADILQWIQQPHKVPQKHQVSVN